MNNSIEIQNSVVRVLETNTEELAEAMKRYAGKSQVVFSALWDKSWELRGQLEKERYKLQCMKASIRKSNRNDRRNDLVAGMRSPERRAIGD
ncbi:hypothetical protein [Cohnella abietis]|uniref:Uncharacterized protein n=1 Tax=Cohnella abietis TaxID=2507935 RepID=A0A3T1D1L9_9BACL|nr:hypothetical protein [Cohnella abietis]BBI32012.1 hypothetical protein KCTCHS21_14110 [Cohnella abietis]